MGSLKELQELIHEKYGIEQSALDPQLPCAKRVWIR